jgi:hypothetical protein
MSNKTSGGRLALVLSAAVLGIGALLGSAAPAAARDDCDWFRRAGSSYRYGTRCRCGEYHTRDYGYSRSRYDRYDRYDRGYYGGGYSRGYYGRPGYRSDFKRGRDMDRDGIPNKYDRDVDGDRIPNRYDRDRDNDGRRNEHDDRPRNPRPR